MHSNQQADGIILEDRLLNFLGYSLVEGVVLDPGDNATVHPEAIFEVCDYCDDSPHEHTVLYQLREKFDIDSVERVGNAIFQKDPLDVLFQHVEVVADLHLPPYPGDEDEITSHYRLEAKLGTTAFHIYATLYTQVRNKRDTLVVHRLGDEDAASNILCAFFGPLSRLDRCVKAIYLDREFYSAPV